MHLTELVKYLDSFLFHDRFTDSSLNGLQVEGAAEIGLIALAVDASQTVIDRAIQQHADLLLTHHGLFWGRPVPLRGMMGARVRALIKSDMSLYVSHLPLDAHPEVGNNARLVDLLGCDSSEPFGEYKGVSIGFIGSFNQPLGLPDLLERIKQVLATPAAELYVWGKPRGPIKRLGIISGGAASTIEEAIAAGCDAFLTGEPHYASVFPAIEQQVPLICAGHYHTEVVGVQALGAHLEQKFGLRSFFIDAPVGL